ncbi:MAG: hypothetical protein SFW08_14325 [Gemmatimonadaceae bacterium]|nr:hypothetical protein [Gemmatimonadaceae bacterium]
MRSFRQFLTLLCAALFSGACVEGADRMLEVTPDADSVVVVAGSGQTAFVRSPVPDPPVVVVKDARGFNIPDAVVTFRPGAGSGRVDGGTVRTDADGRASPGRWTVGSEAGVDTLWASVVGTPGVTGTRAPILASVIDPCLIADPYTVGDSITGSLAGAGCLAFDEHVVKPYRVTIPGGIYQFRARTTGTVPWLDVVRDDGFPFALADGGSGFLAPLTVALGAGTYYVRPGAAGRLTYNGTFSLASQAVTIPNSCPGTPLAYLGIGGVIPGALGTGDCTFSLNLGTVFNGQTTGDLYAVNIPPTGQIVIRLSSLSTDVLLLVIRANTSTISAFNDNGGGGTNALLSLSAAQAGALQGGGTTIWVMATSKGTRGDYTLSIDPLP